MQRATRCLVAHVRGPTMILGAWPATCKFKFNVHTFYTKRGKNTNLTSNGVRVTSVRNTDTVHTNNLPNQYLIMIQLNMAIQNTILHYLGIKVAVNKNWKHNPSKPLHYLFIRFNVIKKLPTECPNFNKISRKSRTTTANLQLFNRFRGVAPRKLRIYNNNGDPLCKVTSLLYIGCL